MKWKRVRPRCRYIVDLPPVEVMKLIESQLRKSSDEVTGSILQHHAYLTIPEKNQHYWSPEFHITIEETETGSLVRGVIGPKPKVWTMFMFLHFVVATLFIGFGIWAYTRASLDEPYAVQLLLMGLMIIAWLALYFSGRMGKAAGRNEMHVLYNFMKKTLDL